MASKIKDPIKVIYSEENRQIDEDFLKTFTGEIRIKLAFNQTGTASTDGHNILVNPLAESFYKNKVLLKKACLANNLPRNLLLDDFASLKFIARAFELHEAFHVLYTDFSVPEIPANYKKADTEFKKKLIRSISNIIEDAYVENAGCSEFDNTRESIVLLNSIILLSYLNDKPDTKPDNTQKTKEELKELKKIETIFTICDMIHVEINLGAKVKTRSKKINRLYEKLRPIAITAATETDALKRADYVLEIFEILEPYIPDIKDDEIPRNRLDWFATELIRSRSFNQDSKRVPVNIKSIYNLTPDPAGSNKDSNKTSANGSAKGGVTDSTTEDKSDSPSSNKDNIDDKTELKEDKGGQEVVKVVPVEEGTKIEADKLIVVLSNHVSAEESEYTSNLIAEFIKQGKEIEYVLADDSYEIEIDGTNIHKGIVLVEKKLRSSTDNKKKYDNYVKEYSMQINKYARQFALLLSEDILEKQQGLSMGHSIMSNKLWDSKQRYWQKNQTSSKVVDIAVMLLLDASGSMGGSKYDNAIKTAILVSEILEKNNVTYSIVEHSANFAKRVFVDILRPFKANKNDKYNILTYALAGGTRDGFTLMWVKDHFKKNVQADKKLLIAITDGMPNDTGYGPPLSIIDTKNSLLDLKKSGILTVAIALGVAEGEVKDIKEIYDNVVVCTNAKELPKKCVEVIAKLFA